VIACLLAGCEGTPVQSAAVPTPLASAPEGRTVERESASSSAATPFRTVELQRVETDAESRLRLVILTKGTSSADRYTLTVFSNDTGREATAVERLDCGCAGRWVVTSYRPRGKRLLRSLRHDLRSKGHVGLGAQLQTLGGGPAAGFTIRSIGRPSPPELITHGAYRPRARAGAGVALADRARGRRRVEQQRDRQAVPIAHGSVRKWRKPFR